MQTRKFAEVAVVHLHPDVYDRLLTLAMADPRPSPRSGLGVDEPWDQLIVEPHRYGCWVHTEIASDSSGDELPASLLAVLREAVASDADWVLFDADLVPLLDLPTYHYPVDPVRPGPGRTPSAADNRHVVFSYLVPVHVEVTEDVVTRVVIIDETPVRKPTVIDGNAGYLSAALAASDNGQDWPTWSFGY